MGPGGAASRFHGELSPLGVCCREEGAFPHLDVLWHYDCVVSPRSPLLLSPSSPVSPSSPPPSAADGVFPAITVSQDAGSTFRYPHRGALLRVFRTFDGDGDGCVSTDELCAIFEKLGLPKSRDSIESLLASSPSRSICSHIDQEEFFMLYDSVCAYVDELDSDTASSLGDVDADGDQDLRAAFHVFDLDGNGFISPEELQTVLCALGFVQARQLDACVDMIARVDENGDGHVDFSEFKKLMGSATPALILSC